MHAPVPGKLLYVPRGHGLHDPDVPVLPAAHDSTQSLAAVLPGSAGLPSGHGVHVEDEVAATLPE